MEYGITEQGFKLKTRDIIKSEMEQRAIEKFGNTINLNENSPLGILIGLLSYQYEDSWIDSQLNYNSQFIETATGQSLDYVANFIGLSRKLATKSTGTIKITGDEGSIVPIDFVVSTGNEILFKTLNTEEVIIGVGGFVTLSIQAVEEGKNGNVAIGLIDNIVNPVFGITSVTNELATQGGDETENDSELRNRYKASLDRAGGSTVNSIRANVLEKTDVSACIVLENDTNTVDGDGLPPKSIGVIVVGGVNQDIAEAIFEKKACGIETYGNISVNVLDDSGITKVIDFSRGTQVEIYADLTLTTNTNFPVNGNDLVIEAIQEYINDELSLGEDVIFNKVVTRIICYVHGVDDVSLTIGTTPSPVGTSNVVIAPTEVANILAENVVIT